MSIFDVKSTSRNQKLQQQEDHYKNQLQAREVRLTDDLFEQNSTFTISISTKWTPYHFHFLDPQYSFFNNEFFFFSNKDHFYYVSSKHRLCLLFYHHWLTDQSYYPFLMSQSSPITIPPIFTTSASQIRSFYNPFSNTYFPNISNLTIYFYLLKEIYNHYSKLEIYTISSPPLAPNYLTHIFPHNFSPVCRTYTTIIHYHCHENPTHITTPVFTTSADQVTIAPNPIKALRAKLTNMKKCISSIKATGLCLSTFSQRWWLETSTTETDGDKEVNTRNKFLSSLDIHKIYHNLQATSPSNQKLDLPEYNGDHNDDIFIDWLIQFEYVVKYKKYKDPKHMLLTEPKLQKDAV